MKDINVPVEGKKIRTRRFRTHAIFNCYTCGKRWEGYKGYKTARLEGYRHAVSTGHKVVGEIGTAYHYD